MSQPRARLRGPTRALRLAGWLALTCFLATLPPLHAQGRGATQSLNGIELSAQTQQSLANLVEQFRQWTVAVEQADANRSGQLVTQMLATAGELGFTQLPDLGAAAAARAAEEARAGRIDRARLALAAAQAFDPESPEQAFAAAAVATHEGHRLTALTEKLRGLRSLSAFSGPRTLLTVNLAIWCLCVLLVAGLIFLALQLIAKGGGLLRDASRLAGRILPAGATLPFAFVCLLWPLALPYGPLWLVLFWSILLWGYGSPSERVVLTVLWLALGTAPLWLDLARQRVAEDLSPPVQALESVQRNRLYGGLFTDLGVLKSTLPEHPAAGRLLADLHRRLGQWDRARALYQEQLVKEPENPGLLLNLGAYAFVTGDPATAATFFKRAAAASGKDPSAEYNLSLAYNEQYFFTEGSAAHARAEEIDRAKVAEWDGQGNEGAARIRTAEDGIRRIPEIRRALVSSSQPDSVQARQSPFVEHGLSFFLGLGCLVVAVTLDLARKPFGYSEPPIDLRLEKGKGERIVRAFLPGLGAVEVGEGFKAYGAALLLAALLLLPVAVPLYRLPVAFDPALAGPLWLIAGAGLALLFGLRLARELRAAPLGREL